MKKTAIIRLNILRDKILESPDYQRLGEIWNIEKRQLLIDSIMNNYDIPKIYFNFLEGKNREVYGNKYNYAIIDGRQRLETIWKFIEDDFALADDFIYYPDEKVKAAGFTYSEIGQKYPLLKVEFDSFVLPIMIVETNDIDIIEDMFSRLNEAVPLNAAEKRNAIGGSMIKGIREVADTKFFKEKVIIRNNRYQHREISARLLFVEYNLQKQDKIIDTKKMYLDDFVKRFKKNKKLDSNKYVKSVQEVLKHMSSVFNKKDSLLNAQAIIPIYYLIFRDAKVMNYLNYINRILFIDFRNEIKSTRKKIENDDIKGLNFDFVTYDKMSVQGTNDSVSIRERVRIMLEFILKKIKK